MRRETENVLLLIVGITAVMIVATGAYTRYVKPSLLPWLLAGGVLIVVLAAAAILRDIRRGGPADPDSADQHDHHHRNTVVWLLLIPVIVLTFIKPPPIGPQAAGTMPISETAVSTDVLRRAFPPLPPDPAPELALPDVLIRIAQDNSGTLDHRAITVIGFTMRSGAQVDLARVVIICCAADAQLARIHLTGPAAAAAANVPENSWVRVQGTVPPGQGDSTRQSIPRMEVRSVTQIEEPRHSYAY